MTNLQDSRISFSSFEEKYLPVLPYMWNGCYMWVTTPSCTKIVIQGHRHWVLWTIHESFSRFWSKIVILVIWHKKQRTWAEIEFKAIDCKHFYLQSQCKTLRNSGLTCVAASSLFIPFWRGFPRDYTFMVQNYVFQVNWSRRDLRFDSLYQSLPPV